MPTPPKPFSVLSQEKKSHRTKKELEDRKKEEKALTSGKRLGERDAVKKNKTAHKEFRRINSLFMEIGKNDALYEPIINRYCLMQAECMELEEKKEYFFQLVEELKTTFAEGKSDFSAKEYTTLLVEFTSQIAKITAQMIAIDKLLQSKRKMLMDIEKENIMTIAAALRSVPKKEEKASNPLLEALKDG